MAQRELDILVRAKGALLAAQQIGKVDTAVGKLGRTAATGLATATRNIAAVGVVAGGVIALGVKSGVSSLAELEDATTQVDGAIVALGLTGQVTSQQVAGWANEIERNVQAAFDDKAITSAAATLLRFGKVAPDNLQPAMQVMTDLAAKTGDMDSAATLLAKALADPAKAAGKLARAGVVLTKSQTDQIKAMVEAGDVVGAQTLLLRELEKTTKGAAAASAGPYRDALNVLADTAEDAQRALGEAFLPVIMKVSDVLGKELAKPETIQRLRDFGSALAGGLDKAIDIARSLPWAQIGTSLQIAGSGAKVLLDAFVALPSWVQTAVITGWGLNKLTGGALGSITGQLASGLIKGVLGMNAGVVNINAGVVNGGPPGLLGKIPPIAAAPGLLAGLAAPIAALVAGTLAPILITKLITDATDPTGERNDQGRVDSALARGIPLAKILPGPANPRPGSSVGGGTPPVAIRTTRAAPVDQRMADAIAAAGFRATAGGLKSSTDQIVRTAERTIQRQDAVMMAQLRADEKNTSRVVEAIRNIVIPPTLVTVRSVAVNTVRASRVVNRPGLGPMID